MPQNYTSVRINLLILKYTHSCSCLRMRGSDLFNGQEWYGGREGTERMGGRFFFFKGGLGKEVIFPLAVTQAWGILDWDLPQCVFILIRLTNLWQPLFMPAIRVLPAQSLLVSRTLVKHFIPFIAVSDVYYNFMKVPGIPSSHVCTN